MSSEEAHQPMTFTLGNIYRVNVMRNELDGWGDHCGEWNVYYLTLEDAKNYVAELEAKYPSAYNKVDYVQAAIREEKVLISADGSEAYFVKQPLLLKNKK